MNHVDFLIVGHGLAGATLAWQLRWLGVRVAVIDRENVNSASRVAAGLITPITGRQNKVSYRFAEFWKEAKTFYRRVEQQTGKRLLHTDRTLRVLDEESSRTLRADEESLRYLLQTRKLQPPFRVATAVELASAARLAVTDFLDASRDQLRAEGHYYSAELGSDCGFETSDQNVCIANLNLTANRVIFCQGIEAKSNRIFSELPFEPAKGEILELHAEELRGAPTLLKDIWMIPTDGGRCLVGATYDSEFETTAPTPLGRRRLLNQLADLISCPVQVIDHRAAVRPILRGRLPKIGLSEHDRRFGFFNGLGSKGALRAPEIARQFAAHLVNGQQVDPAFWYDRSTAARPDRRLTDMAQEIVSRVVHNNAIVVDATAGNGFDTVFLSRTVGPQGRVYAIDIQAEAIERTAAKLKSVGSQNVHLVRGSHADINTHVPAQHHGKISAIMFNLGYLPRGAKHIVTTAATTILAVAKSIELLRPGGVITIVAYTGHAGGLEETEAIETFMRRTAVRQECQCQLPPTQMAVGRPRLYVIQKTT